MSNIIYPKTKIYTDGNVTGSGTVANPLNLKDVISLSSITASNIVITETASINILNTVEANSLKIGDKYITIMSGANTQAELDGAGILFGSASSGEVGEQESVAHIVYKDSGDQIEIYPGLKVSGSTHIIGNLTASNVSGNLIGPASGILSGAYPGPSGLKGPIIPISGTTTLSTINQGNNLTIDPSGSLSLKSHAFVGNVGGGIELYSEGAVPSNIYSPINITSRDGNVLVSTGTPNILGTYGKITFDCNDLPSVSSYNGQINLGNNSTQLTQINIGTSTSTGSVPIITLGKSKTPIILKGPEIRTSVILVPTDSVPIQANSPSIQLNPVSNITMSATPTVVYDNSYGSRTFPVRNSPDGVRISLINTSDNSICFLNDTSTVPTHYTGSFTSSSLKLGASERILKKWGVLELQYQISGSSGGGYWIETNFSNNLTGCVDLSPYALLSGSVITASSMYTKYIDFDTSSYDLTAPTTPGHRVGRTFFDSGSGDIVTAVNHTDLYLKNGQQLIQRVKNADTVVISKGQVVHITGSDQSNAAVPRIRLADWMGDNMSANTLGVAMTDMATAAEGFIIVSGMLEGINTNIYNGGDILYLSSSGGFTSTKPTAPKHTVSIGQVIRTGNDQVGSIYVKIQNGYELDELHDVSASIGKTNGDLLIWDNTNSVWKNSKSLSGSYEVTGNVSFTNGNGINFGISSNPSASYNILDDYEEGTWTPRFSGSTGAGDLTYTFNSGSYIKTGRVITINGRIDLDTTSSAPTGDLYVVGLPYASRNYFGTNNVFWQGTCTYLNMGSDPSGSIIYWCQMDDAENVLAIKRGYNQFVDSNVLVSSQSDFSFSITYFTN